MKGLTNLSIALLLALFSISNFYAQERGLSSVNNQNFGSRVSDAAGGYSFGVPSGWTKKDGDGGFAMVNAEQTVLIAVKAHNYKDFQAFAANANLASENLEQIGETQDFGTTGKWFRAAKKTDKGVLVIDSFILFSPFGGGTAIVAFTIIQTRKRPCRRPARSPKASALQNRRKLLRPSEINGKRICAADS